MAGTKSSPSAKKLTAIMVIVLFIVAVLLTVANQRKSGIVVNEIAHSQADNRDWIEFYNPSNHNLKLDGLYLSDDKDNLQRYQFGGTFIVPAGGFAVIYGDRDSSERPNQATNFNIRAGETVYLTASDGKTVIDSFYVPENSNAEGVTYGRSPNGSDNIVSMAATPSASNAEEIE